MIARVGRLVRGEWIKLSSHPFLYACLGILSLFTFLRVMFSSPEASEWRPINAIQLFSCGFQLGLHLAAYVLVIFSSMIVAGEFDRGTIKNLLTRPITRLDLFAAKALTVALLGMALYVFTLYLALTFALARGELGHVWDSAHYIMDRSFEDLSSFARKAVMVSFLPFLVAGFWGLFVSNWTESSGYAVAIALVVYLAAELVTAGLLTSRGKEKVFLYYSALAVEKLKLYAEGSHERWPGELESSLLYVKVPLLYAAGFLPAGFGIFRARNIHA